MKNLIGGVSVTKDLKGIDLGDERLNTRAVKIVERLQRRPSAGFPQAMVTDAEVEAFYRFVRNKKATFDAILKPHVDATLERCSESPVILAVHDSSEFRFSGKEEREGLGCVQKSGHGFLGHFVLAVAPGEIRDPLGVLHVEKMVRKKKQVTKTQLVRKKKVSHTSLRDMETEQMRWNRGVTETVSTLDEVSTRTVHIMDSEADDYSILSHLTALKQRFVVRLHYNRLLVPDESGEKYLKGALQSKPVIAKREVYLSPRGRHAGGNSRKRNPQRKAREATLEIRRTQLTLRKPNAARTNLPASLPLNVVYVRERNAPSGTVPVEWVLATTEEIATKEQILAVVDYYRARWVIEEFFKALKTGCAFEKRQLESAKTLYVALALLVPVAWRLLRIRALGRLRPGWRASVVISKLELRVLRGVMKSQIRREMSENPTVGEVMLAIAKLGGHLRSNGDPGWQVLGKGYRQLQEYVIGYLVAKEM